MFTTAHEMFIDAFINGSEAINLDACIAYWHTYETGNTLQEFLGMSNDQYKQFLLSTTGILNADDNGNSAKNIKHGRITVNMDIARKMLPVAGYYDARDASDEQIIAILNDLFLTYGASFQVENTAPARWEDRKTERGLKTGFCSACGKNVYDNIDADIWSAYEPPLCPNCGNPMEVAK